MYTLPFNERTGSREGNAHDISPNSEHHMYAHARATKNYVTERHFLCTEPLNGAQLLNALQPVQRILNPPFTSRPEISSCPSLCKLLRA